MTVGTSPYLRDAWAAWEANPNAVPRACLSCYGDLVIEDVIRDDDVPEDWHAVVPCPDCRLSGVNPGHRRRDTSLRVRHQQQGMQRAHVRQAVGW